MKQLFILYLLFSIQFFSLASNQPVAASPESTQSNLTITQPSSGTLELSWPTCTQGRTSYIIIEDNIMFQQLVNTSTTGNTATFSGFKPGTSVKITFSNACDYIEVTDVYL